MSSPRSRTSLLAGALLVLWAMTVGLLFAARLGLRGDLAESRDRLEETRAELRQASAQRIAIERRLLEITTNPSMLEVEARRQLLLVRPGEVLYRISSDDSASAPREAQETAQGEE